MYYHFSKDVRLPVQLQRAMAAEAEAAREARAKVIAAEGEEKASTALRAASEMITCSPGALQLRYLQTLNSISAEKNSTIIFPVPMDLISNFLGRKWPYCLLLTTRLLQYYMLFMFWIIKEALLFYFISALNLMFKWKNPILEEKKEKFPLFSVSAW